MISKQILWFLICFPTRLNPKILVFLFIAADINGTLTPLPSIIFFPFGTLRTVIQISQPLVVQFSGIRELDMPFIFSESLPSLLYEL